ncbi:hypothetical protein KGM_204013 [Danaus plexippus plexippus]|uniref:Uncharacterized protein n=1 Tax=Danaus plexippus plexippus TaxID=278856 RepID=A0A212ERB1_DANPL|nr:hypothetical protein KGM_204013 [Danaus plexippus plexippus]
MFTLVLLALVAQAFAGEYIDARCPVVRPVDNFNYASVLTHIIFLELSWIVSRTKTLRSDFKALIDRYLLESKVLDLSKYIFPDFSDNVCRIDF